MLVQLEQVEIILPLKYVVRLNVLFIYSKQFLMILYLNIIYALVMIFNQILVEQIMMCLNVLELYSFFELDLLVQFETLLSFFYVEL